MSYENGVEEKKIRYYIVGDTNWDQSSYPNPEDIFQIRKFEGKRFCAEIGKEAIGYIEYNRKELDDTQLERYELEKQSVFPFYCVLYRIFPENFENPSYARIDAKIRIEDVIWSDQCPETTYDNNRFGYQDCYQWFPSLREAAIFAGERVKEKEEMELLTNPPEEQRRIRREREKTEKMFKDMEEQRRKRICPGTIFPDNW